MSKNKIKDKKQNKPYYISKNFVNGKQKQPEKTPVITKKFQLGIDINKNPFITIDNVLHFMNGNQFHAFTLACINVNKKVNPEIDYSKILVN